MRIVLLNRFPLGFHEDEVKVGWNAYSILKTGKDDLGNRFAMYYNTFGDYRPTGIFYATIPSILLFGVTQTAVRFPAAFFGALTVFPVYYLTLLLQKRKRREPNKIAALMAALFLAVSPWHIFTSRATSEAVICLFFALMGITLFIGGITNEKKKYLIVSFTMFFISTLFYHMVRPLLPLFVFTILVYYWQHITPLMRKSGFIFCVFISILSLLLLTTKASRGRFEQVAVAKYQENVLGTHTSRFEIPTLIKNEYAKYLGPDFLIGDTPKPYRYRVFGVGLLSMATLLFFVIGLTRMAQRKISVLPFALLFLSPIPAAVTGEDAPNLHRALFMLPFIVIIAGFGAQYLWENGFFKRTFFLILFAFLSLSTVTALVVYFTSGDMDAAPYRNYGSKVVAAYMIQYEDQYSHIIVSDDPDSLYPWYAFADKKDPKEFNAQAINRLKGDWTYRNITFTQNKCPSSDFLNDKTIKGPLLVVDSPFCDTTGTQTAHPQVKLELLPNRAPAESQYHFWERK